MQMHWIEAAKGGDDNTRYERGSSCICNAEVQVLLFVRFSNFFFMAEVSAVFNPRSGVVATNMT